MDLNGTVENNVAPEDYRSTHDVINTYPLHKKTITSFDGAGIQVIVTGQKTGHRTLFFSAPGLPIELSQGWIKALSSIGEVICVETRGLIGPDAEFVDDVSVRAQVTDARIAMEHEGWAGAHVVGVCGGAVLALQFRQVYRDLIDTISLWCGDYFLDMPGLYTEHQRNIKSLMEMVVKQPTQSCTIRTMLLSLVSKELPVELKHWLLHPYSNDEIFRQYCRMNYAIMDTPCQPLLTADGGPAQIVSLLGDQTTCSEGSEHIAHGLGVEHFSVEGTSHLDITRGRACDSQRVIEFQLNHKPLHMRSVR